MLELAEQHGYTIYLKAFFPPEDQVKEARDNLREYLSKDEDQNDVR